MNLNKLAYLTGAGVATLTLSACGADEVQTVPQLSIAVPADGAGKDWMQPNKYINYEGLGMLAQPTDATPQQYNGVAMFGECVFVIGPVPGSELFESALVLNDRSKSIGQNTGGTIPKTIEFLGDNWDACFP